MFRIGQRVVLVGWKSTYVPAWKSIGAVYPEVGEVYTIRDIRPYPKGICLLLEEIDNSHLCMREPGFEQNYFRPVLENKTKTSAFAEIWKILESAI